MMPEGPEVEHVSRILRKLENKTIKSIQLTELSQKYNKYRGKKTEFSEFSKCKLIKIERQGKFILFRFNNNKVILNHLGMSGKWFLTNDDNKISKLKHPKAIITTEDPRTFAIFDDARNFGQFRKFPNYDTVMNYPPIKKLGLDGLELPFPLSKFHDTLKQKRNMNKAIAIALLDQTIVAGIGNIYKSESLFRAKINPVRFVKNLENREIEALGKAISITLQQAVKSMGSTIQSYRNPYGEEGSAQNWHAVYAKEGKPCNLCGTPITRILQNKRSTFFCEKCQK